MAGPQTLNLLVGVRILLSQLLPYLNGQTADSYPARLGSIPR